ncbi:MAG: YbaK/EbsC family protein [Rhodospirillales bacterium]|nr:YbaK/EbsC family protein [Rhodospirillales bacterium]
MAVAITLKQFLSNRNVAYETLLHEYTQSALESASKAHIPGDRLAKAVLLTSGSGQFVLAVLPATHLLEMDKISEYLGMDVYLASEDDMAELFTDCAIGAIPPAGKAYGLKTVWDDSLSRIDDIYFEGGDHNTLVHVNKDAFLRIMADSEHTILSHHL